MAERDNNGDNVGEWAEKEDFKSGKCIWCQKSFQYNSAGKHAFLRHAKGDHHKHVANGRKGRLVGQPPAAMVAVDANQNEAELEIDVQPRGGGGGQRGVELGEGRGGYRAVGSLSDRVMKAEITWSLKVVSSGFSYKSCNDIVEVLKLMDNESDVFKKMSLKEDKVSYIISHGLFPHFMKKTVDAVRKSPGVSLCTYGSTFKQKGLSTHIDIGVRYWDESAGEVVDDFLDFHSVGHEPADLQVRLILASLEKANIHQSKVVCLSRDNPNVMKRVFKLLEESFRAANNPKLVDAPCLLHPTHTSFQKAMLALDENIGSLLANIHSFFKVSTARREDMIDVREEMADELEEAFDEVLDQFFLRHVETRWLQAAPCIDRILQHWASTVEYFGKYIPNSRLANNKNAVQSKMYKKIMQYLSDDQVVKTKIRLKFLSFLAHQTKTFLTLLQSEQPMIHILMSLALATFQNIARLVIKVSKVPKKVMDVSNLDLEDPAVLMHSHECGYLVNLEEEMALLLTSESRKSVRHELRNSVVIMLKYLQSHIPFDQPIYTQFGFIDPINRKEASMPINGVKVATFLNRFTVEEKQKIGLLLNQYASLPDEEVPKFDKKRDRVDHFWVNVFKKLEELNSEKPESLESLVKLTCIQTHGNAFMERGLGLTKRIVDGRSSMNDVSVKAQKVVMGAVKRYGGPDKVPITTSLMNSVKYAAMKEREEAKKAKEDKEKKEKERISEEDARKRKRENDEIKRTWVEKRDTLENQIKACKEFIDSQGVIQGKAMERGLVLTKPGDIKAAMRTADFARQAAVEKGVVLSELQDKIKHPRNLKLGHNLDVYACYLVQQ